MSSKGGCNVERNEKEKNHSDKIKNKEKNAKDRNICLYRFVQGK
jgi:hypothetical protein